jgi:2,5-furandicarboxylate decarboxylase 1
MNLHHCLDIQNVQEIDIDISTDLEAAAILKKLEPQPALFNHVRTSRFKVAGNLFCQKNMLADYFGIPTNQFITYLASAIQKRSTCEIIKQAPCQQVISVKPDLDQLPILRHFATDGGPYITSGVMVAIHPRYGLNLDFHRCMQISQNEMAVRVVKGRHFDAFLNELGVVEVALCVGLPPNILIAAATSVDIGISELEIANALEPVRLVHARTVDVLVPSEAEFVIEGRIYRDRLFPEGPFVDLTETIDIVREQPVFEVSAITHREDAIWQALLPGGLEHKLLMGMPREPTIFNSVNNVVECLDVHINPGGCSWLHAIVQINKKADDDGTKAIQAAFTGHRSCKHIFVVDRDIDIYNPLEVEWAFATRFQGDKDLVVIGRERGSSLDPSADQNNHETYKIGFDLTKPISTSAKTFEKVSYQDIDLNKYIYDLAKEKT